MKNFLITISLFLIFGCMTTIPVTAAWGGEDSFTHKDREMLIRIDERLNQIDKRFEQIDKRFEQVDKRFEQVDKRFEQVDKRFAELREDMNKRFEQVDKRFEQVDKRFESLQELMIGIVATFGALVAATIGFAIWDRRTMIRPFETRIREIEAVLVDEKDVIENKRNINKIIEAMKRLARHDSRIAEVLKSVSLL